MTSRLPGGEPEGAPLVSVLLPTYDRARYLGGSILSVLAQTFPDLELIVVDDGSTDETGRVLERISDPRLCLLRQEHRGSAAALNAGLRVARGQYVARNDSDDVWLPGMLAALVPVIEADPGLGFVYARASGINEDGRANGTSRGFPMRDPDDPFWSLLHSDCTASICAVYRRSALEKVGGFDETIGPNEDWELALRVAREFGVGFVDQVIARVRTHPGNVTALTCPDLGSRLALREVVLDRIFADHTLPERARAVEPIAYRNLHIGNAMQWMAVGNMRQALRALAAALRSGANPLTTSLRTLWVVFLWFGIGRSERLQRAAYASLRRIRSGRRRKPAARAA